MKKLKENIFKFLTVDLKYLNKARSPNIVPQMFFNFFRDPLLRDSNNLHQRLYGVIREIDKCIEYCNLMQPIKPEDLVNNTPDPVIGLVTKKT